MNSVPFRTLMVLVFVDMLTQGLAYPCMPALIMELGKVDIQAAAMIYGWLIPSYAIFELVGSPSLGLLSDRFGRKPILIVSTAGASASFLISALATSLPMLFAGYALAGLTSAMVVVVNSSIADLTEGEERGKAFAFLGAVFGVGFVVGPAAGALTGPLGLRAPYFFASGAMAICAVAALLFMPETRKPSTEPTAPKLADFLQWMAIRAVAAHPIIRRLAWTTLLNALAMQMLVTVWVPYTTYRYRFGPVENGWLLAGFGLAMAVSQGLIAPKLLPRVGNVRSVQIGFVASILSYIGYGLSPSWQWLLAVTVAGALAALDEPALQAIIADLAGEDQQGAIQGGLGSIMSLMRIVGPVLGTALFGAFTGPRAPIDLPGVTYFAGAILVVIAAINGVTTLRRIPTPQNP